MTITRLKVIASVEAETAAKPGRLQSLSRLKVIASVEAETSALKVICVPVAPPQGHCFRGG